MNSCCLQSRENNTRLGSASSRGHSTLETAALEVQKGGALENWVSPSCTPDFFACPQENWEVNWSFIVRDKMAFFFFFPQLIFYWISGKVDLQQSLQGKREINKYQLLGQWGWVSSRGCEQGSACGFGAHIPEHSNGNWCSCTYNKAGQGSFLSSEENIPFCMLKISALQAFLHSI